MPGLPMIEQTIEFPDVSPAQLFETYLDSARHSAAIGASAEIERRVGGTFRAFNGNVVGTILHLVPNRMIVQTWRSLERWKAFEPDSILVLSFDEASGGAKIKLAQTGIPERDVEFFNQGWYVRYWWPWTEHFHARSSREPPSPAI
jgi:activator of HSP90 ATPase